MSELYKKLFEFRKLTGKVAKSTSNPFFKSKYADLNSVIEATDPALEEVGLAYIDRVEGKVLISEIIDIDTGDIIRGEIPLILTKEDMQQLGSAITYARRYARMALLGLQAVDDDGNHVSGKVMKEEAKVEAKYISEAQLKKVNTLMSLKKVDRDQIKAHYKVTTLKELPLTAVQPFIEYLEAL